MKKFLVLAVILVAFASCQNSVSNDYKLSSLFNSNFVHTIFQGSEKDNTDSSKSANNKQFNFFLKDGIAKKFGL